MTGEFYHTCKEKIIPILFNLFQKTEAQGIFPTSFYEANIILISKPDEDIKRKKNNLQTSTSNEHKCKNPQKILAYWIFKTYKKIYKKTKWDLFQVCKADSMIKN